MYHSERAAHVAVVPRSRDVPLTTWLLQAHTLGHRAGPCPGLDRPRVDRQLRGGTPQAIILRLRLVSKLRDQGGSLEPWPRCQRNEMDWYDSALYQDAWYNDEFPKYSQLRRQVRQGVWRMIECAVTTAEATTCGNHTHDYGDPPDGDSPPNDPRIW